MLSHGITMGVCAMEKKVTGKPMKEILKRLEGYGFIIVVFQECVIVNDPIEEWPLCDCLIAFYSSGYPLAKAEAYSDLRKPYVVNDLHLQWALMDRIKMYELLEKHNVPTPRHVIVDHTSPDQSFKVLDDHVIFQGVKLKKPVVEKPQDGDDHNVRIYWPTSSGGGCTNLFRKIGDRSSEYVADVTNVRTDGVYIYEEFVNTHGVDVKVYTCGPDYAHAEARKAPAMDGRVRRNERGKEERYPVILNEAEKLIARTVVLAFKQNICGLDLLRSKSGSVVCDVNGWSFVKDSAKYWDDTALTLSDVCRNAIWRIRSGNGDEGNLWSRIASPAGSSVAAAPQNGQPESKKEPRLREKLLCVSIVARHADRTPKQKMKMTTKHETLLAFCDVKNKNEEVKLKQTAELQSLLEASLLLLDGSELLESTDRHKLTQLRHVLEMSPLEGMSFYRKVQLKPKKFKDNVLSEMQLILKWGGKLTHAGKLQARELGHDLRMRLYPARDCGYSGAGGSLLRLHSTYRHDLKIYTSDEGRVILSAAAFAKGLLDLDGALPPIASMMLQSDEAATMMLDIMPEEGRVQMDNVKAELSRILHGDVPESPEILEDESLHSKLKQLRETFAGSSPNECMRQLHNSLKKLVEELAARIAEEAGVCRTVSASSIPIVPHMNHNNVDPVEELGFVYARWRRLEEEFFDEKKDRFEISKLPDIYDCSLYDSLHNQPLQLKSLPELHRHASDLAKFMVPLEYGLTKAQKSTIGVSITNRLLRKLYGDLHKEVDPNDDTEYRLDHHAVNASDIRGVDRRVHTRLYFTSESHIISLLNVLRWGHIHAEDQEGEPLLSPEAMTLFDSLGEDGMAFLTHLVLSVHEVFDYPSDSLDRFRVRIIFSPGANGEEFVVTNAVPLTAPEGLPLAKVADFFNDVFLHSGFDFAEDAKEVTMRPSSKGYSLGLPQPPLDLRPSMLGRSDVLASPPGSPANGEPDRTASPA